MLSSATLDGLHGFISKMGIKITYVSVFHHLSGHKILLGCLRKGGRKEEEKEKKRKKGGGREEGKKRRRKEEKARKDGMKRKKKKERTKKNIKNTQRQLTAVPRSHLGVLEGTDCNGNKC